MKIKLLLSAFIVFIALIISFSFKSVISVLSYWFLSALLIYCIFREKEEKEERH